MRNRVLAFLALAVLPAHAANPEFRVELLSNRRVKALTLEAAERSVNICGGKSDGQCLVLLPGKRISCSADRLLRCRLQATNRNFALLTVDSTSRLRFTPTFENGNEPPRTFLLGNVDFKSTNAGLQVVTRVDLESYVSGVLRGEASVLTAPAARQAMAILARTWALRWQGRHRHEGFDFCTLTHCQVFRFAQSGESSAVNGLDPAVVATRGQVLQYQGALADPYFTASCGGMTESAKSVWPDRAQPYLISTRDQYCLSSNHALWKQAITTESIQQVLRYELRLPMAAPLTDLSVEERDPSGRAKVLRAVAGATWKFDANQFRYAIDRRLGWEQIKSNLYTIERQEKSWVFIGQGLGHGVGLCQAGAEQMARMGSSTGRILGTYFPGTQVALQSSDDPDPIASSEHFEIIFSASQEPWVQQTLDTLEQWRKQLGEHAAILPPRIRVETWATVGEFIAATGQPGWMAASSDGQSIALQPLELLARKRILNATLRHELTHLAVHRLRAEDVPRWFEEGWVLYLTGERIEASTSTPMTKTELEKAITQPRSEAEMKTAYAQALKRVRQLALRKGGAALWRVLAHPDTADLRWLQETL